MAKLIGVVSKVIGQVFAVGSDGSRRPLIEGDRLYAGEQLETAATGAVAVRLQNGGELTLGRDSSQLLSADLLGHPAHPGHEVAPSDNQLSDVERIQRAIASGDDPSRSAEPTAAGAANGNATGALGGGHSFVLLSEVGARVDPHIGFPTAGFNGIPEFAQREVGALSTALDNGNPDAPNGGNVPDGGTPPEQPQPPIPVNNPVTLIGLDLSPAEISLNEANLPLGSASDPAALTQRGSFTVVAQDGVFNLNVGGINVVTGGVVTGVGQSITTGLGNTLTVTGYNPATGEVSYSYTLTDAGQHIENDGAKTLSEQLVVRVSDSNGDVAQGSLDVVIHDDAPTAVNDTNPVAATEQHTELTGNVLTNDVQGADRVAGGPVLAGTFTGTYGTLVLATDGSYTYTLNSDGAAFKNLGGGGSGEEHFTYTIKDADGDTSSATLTLNISNLDDPVTLDGLGKQGGELTVYEKHLADGSAPDATALTQQGTFKVTAADGLQTLTVGGISVVSGGVSAGLPQSTVTPQGNTLTILGFDPATGTVTYSYTLTGSESHPNGDGSNVISEHFEVVAKDIDGSTASGSLDVNIVDDVPKAVDDSNAVTATEQHTELTGNVLTNDVQGADRVAGGPVLAGTFTGTYGTLVLATDGSYTYTLNSDGAAFKNLGGGGSGEEHFTYTIKDADGDTSSATLTLNVSNLDDPVTLDGLAQQGGELTVYEKNLAAGSSPDAAALTQQGTFKVTAADGLQTLSVGGISVVSGGVAAGFPQSTVTPEGNTLTILGFDPATGTVTYSYTLTGSESHPNGDGSNVISEHFEVVAKDIDGSTASGSLDVNIVDDVPQAVADYTGVAKGDVVRGNVMYNDVVGADVRSDGNYVVGVRAGSDTSTSAIGQLNTQVQGQYGYLTIDAQGNAEYHSNPNVVAPQDAVDSFVYTIRDADGDESTTTVNITVHNSLMACQDRDVTVYEKALATGSDPDSPAETASGTLADSARGGVGTLTFSLVGDATGQYGQLHLNPDGTYTYTLTSPANSSPHANDGANTVTETFTYQVQDSLGNTTTSTLVVSIVDDVPHANADYVSVGKGDVVRGNVMYNDVVGADTLSDGHYVVGVRAGSDTSSSAIGQLNTQVQGQYGYLTIDAQGNAEYHASPDVASPRDAIDSFVYTIRDADGDESTTTITISVHDPRLEACESPTLTVFEKALDLHKDGSDLAAGTVTGSDPSSTGETASGTLVGSVVGGVGALTYSLVGDAVGHYGQISINPDGTYTYTLTSPANTPGADSAIEYFTYQATDTHGNSVTNSIAITIVDDVPQAVCAERSISPGQVDTNILLVIDVSSSMASASGVPGLTRLDLAKQAISALLDKYDDMGDIKVQIVTFGTGAQVQAAQWLTIDQAKAIVSGLHASGVTHYDAATTAAQTAYAEDGKLAGAQNVSYFFSDGAPTNGHAISGARETSWESFLDSNGIKSYAIGLGKDVNEGNLNPLAYDGTTHTDTDSVVVTDLSQLNGVLSGTVLGASITGSLMSGGTFGADGGFIKVLLVDGTSYTYDPKANAGQGGYQASGGVDKASFDTTGNTLTIKTSLGGSLVVDMDNGDFTYTGPKSSDSNQVERFGFTVSDNDGDTSSASLVVRVNANNAPVAVADHIITNISGPASISVAADVLLANDSDADHDRLNASPITFTTHYADDKAADFTRGGAIKSIVFDGHGNTLDNQFKALDRSAFTTTTGTMTAALMVLGYLGNVTTANANGEDVITVSLRKGETLQLDHDRPAGNLGLEWKDDHGNYQPIADGGSFTASHDGVYSIHVTNQVDPIGNSKAAENYKLSLVLDYSNAVNEVHQASYTVTDGHGGSATGIADISYQSGQTLNGTSGADVLMANNADTVLNGGDGNDVLVAGAGNNQLYGGNGDDLLIGGPGNDLLDGGAGNDTASYKAATAGVTVDLSISGPQHTGGAGVDTLVSIENLIGSDYNDTLIGNAGDNVLNGGLGNDVLKGGDGNDILIGGPGDDTLTGGNGNDTFVWQKGDTGHDTVTDFTPGSDHLDLSQLLQGENATAASLDDYLHFKVSGTGSQVVSTIEVSSVAGAAPTQTIDLAGVDLAQHYGVTAGAGGVIAAGHDTATIINGMINDHSLKVDTV
ncbi:retention module-containing protein [Pantoea sp. Tr-811]|uniref:retention module-containing protein n=1 Tax=Pantoea sp. Tr-811 TaxID=2608361 RepID=UPI0014203995|nr:retention module-containing protein [Pantoea sp. Tr-811]NIF29279.1 retention module-containing protein [Pantoea sp. Tr-811]